jgi:hypothetical protein
MNGDNLKNLRRETNRTFKNKRTREILKDKLNKLKNYNKNKSIRDCRGYDEFKKWYQPRINIIIKDENGNLLEDFQSRKISLTRP